MPTKSCKTLTTVWFRWLTYLGTVGENTNGTDVLHNQERLERTLMLRMFDITQVKLERTQMVLIADIPRYS